MTESLGERVEKFMALELPGQPRMMHMGTSYLVNELWAEVKRLQKAALPDIMTPAISDALSRMCFQTGPISDVLRAGGHDIKRRAEEEQAYCLFWFLKMVISHGDNWRKVVGEELNRCVEVANSRRM